MNRLTRREWIQTGLTGLGVMAAYPEAGQACTSQEFSFHHDHVVGTSLDCWVVGAERSAAQAAERMILDEIERLRRVFSTFDAESELGRLNRATGSVAASSDLLAVLREYELWGRLSNGACRAQVGALVKLWDEAQKTGALPDDGALAEAVERLGAPAWRIEPGNRVKRLSDQPLNLNSIAKGYILHKAAEAVRTRLPAATGLLLNLGGDICSWQRGANETAWQIGVQDPAQPADNARPLTALRLANAAVATSGGYQRYYDVAGKRYSHLLDPRTGRPADGVASATVCAPTSIVANVLATTLCVLKPLEGLRLVASLPATQCLLITADGRQLRSKGFAELEVPVGDDKPAKPSAGKADAERPKGDPWPAGYQTTISLGLPKPTSGRRIRRPYVAIWVENAGGKSVRTVTVWGTKPRWLPTLTGWWKGGRTDGVQVKSVTRATRSPGQYSLVWDGKDDNGKPVPQGTYTVHIEVHREHGKHVFQVGKLTCGTEPTKLTLEKNAETDATVIEYGKRK